MSTLAKIKEAQLSARKNKFSDVASLLTTIIGEAEMVGKNAGSREPTESEVLQVLKKFEKGMVETIGYLKPEQTSKIAIAEGELKIVRAFLPAKMTDLQVQKDIGTVMQKFNLAREQKSLGIITKELRVKYGEQFDGQQVSAMFKQMMI